MRTRPVTPLLARCLSRIIPGLLLSAPLSAQLLSPMPERFTERVDSLVEAEMKRQEMVGFSLAVLQGGRIVLERGYGLANVEHAVPATPETIYQSGSLGKQFTAAGIMLLVQEGRLNLSDPVRQFFPEAPAAWGAITIRHLLTHTGGTGDYAEGFDYRKDWSEDELRAYMFARPLAFTPGERWEYSNLGYVLLGQVIHRVTGQFYGDFLAARIFGPAGMTTTRIISESDIVPHRAAGYHRVDGTVKNQEWVSPALNTTADGSLYFTVRDLARWDSVLYGDDLLSAASMAAIRTPVRLNDGSEKPYGFGWFVGTTHGHAVMAHSGSWQGFTSYIVRFPDDRLTITGLANLDEAKPSVISWGIAGLWDPALTKPPGL
jgi:CubicO group peptidase (beta-lactamase class C family)